MAAAPSAPPAAAAPDLGAIKASISCVDAFNALFFCASPAHQFDRW
jgi:hypothetical protein